MRWPRFRLTMWHMMALVFAAGLIAWGGLVAWPERGEPTVAEQLAEGKYRLARLMREVAELADVEFPPGVDPESVKEIRGAAALAGSDLQRAIDRLKWSSGMSLRGFVSKATPRADGLTLRHAAFDAEQAESQLAVLKDSAEAGYRVRGGIFLDLAIALDHRFHQVAQLAANGPTSRPKPIASTQSRQGVSRR